MKKLLTAMALAAVGGGVWTFGHHPTLQLPPPHLTNTGLLDPPPPPPIRQLTKIISASACTLANGYTWNGPGVSATYGAVLPTPGDYLINPNAPPSGPVNYDAAPDTVLLFCDARLPAEATAFDYAELEYFAADEAGNSAPTLAAFLDTRAPSINGFAYDQTIPLASCTGPLQTTLSTDSWSEEGTFTPPLESSVQPSLDGCNRLPFEPSITVAPDGQQGSSPTGLSVGIHVPQEALLNKTGLAEANVRDTAVTLPAGIGLNPAAADGLQACSESQIALSADTAPACPEASKVATVEIKTPLLPNALTGAAYLAAQDANPFGSLVALYIVAQDPVSGTLVKVAGEVTPNAVTGQLVATFKNTPQLPFEDLTLHFFGGSRAPLGTPAACGSYTTRASIAPWSGNAPAEPTSTFQITSGPNGSPCASPLPFDPSLAAGSTNIQAGAFTPFTTTMSREDGNQSLDAIQLHMPDGLSGSLSGVKLCGEAEANAGTCGPESLIGHTVVSVGLGGNPYTVTGGEVFITGPYKGAPFGLSIVNPAKAGPFDLGKVIVRAKIEVDPTTAALTITTDASGPYAIPQILDGTSMTYLVGERYLNPDMYFSGASNYDDQGWDIGYDFDTNRWTAPDSAHTPLPDTPGLEVGANFGSAPPGARSTHVTCFFLLFCENQQGVGRGSGLLPPRR